MKGSHVGLLAGLLLGVAAVGGIGYLFLALLLGVVGMVLGHLLEDRFDLGDLLRGRDR